MGSRDSGELPKSQLAPVRVELQKATLRICGPKQLLRAHAGYVAPPKHLEADGPAALQANNRLEMDRKPPPLDESGDVACGAMRQHTLHSTSSFGTS